MKHGTAIKVALTSFTGLEITSWNRLAKLLISPIHDDSDVLYPLITMNNISMKWPVTYAIQRQRLPAKAFVREPCSPNSYQDLVSDLLIVCFIEISKTIPSSLKNQAAQRSNHT